MSKYDEVFGQYGLCCMGPEPGVIEQIISDYYNIAFKCIDPLTLSGFAKQIYGQVNSNDVFDKINNFHYLLGTLLIIYHDRWLQFQEDPSSVFDYEELFAKYNLECFRKTLECQGCAPNTIQQLFALFEIDIVNLMSFADGVGYMNISPGDPLYPTIPLNRVS